MTRKIRWGIMGAGGIAHKFASDLSLVEGAELIAIGSRAKGKADEFTSRYAIKYSHGSYEELVKNEEVDVIYIATPHSHHYDNTLLCFEHNKAVLCEKAFAVNSVQAREMIRVAKEKKLFLMEALWTKFLPHYQRLMTVLNENLLGDIKSVLINFGFMPKEPVPARLFDPALAGGTILDIGIYNVFIAMSVLGRPDEIDARMTASPEGVDEQCAILFKYRNGAMAQLFSSFLTHLPTEAEISGTKGRIKLTHRFYTPEASIEYYPGKHDSLRTIDFAKETSGHGYQHEARHVVECLQKGLTESPILTHESTLVLMEVLDEIRKKAGVVYPADREV